MITIQNLSLSYDDEKFILNNINMEIGEKEIVAILGPSGAGKSSLLRSINFLNKPNSGNVIIDGVKVDASNSSKKSILELRKKTAMVFQNYNLFKNMTVLDNLIVSLTEGRGIGKKKANEIALEHLKKVSMSPYVDYYPDELSGGQQQRVGIARAISLSPKVLLLDEPTSALDPQLVNEIKNVIQTLIQSNKSMTILLVTHDIDFAMKLADRILFIDEGHILFDGSKDEFLNVNDVNISKFMNRLKSS
ncbi:amino acid ABC transporter ATP-binding protein [Falseniella ignava]|uniref:ABC transporter domain-containing protein n=1 Tax=Falseniella ignava CCUG 37419 TaxID=883112 RepID=K1LMC3_9LACT|nr:amino acid ABC transporter ATP-binding protein [Falseniella ignava]EKB55771.1 hypothetical protein HMPREF9707_00958 [Falseniella ignava CCUG 37419]